MLLEDFSNCRGYKFLHDYLLYLERKTSDEAREVLRNVVLLIQGLVMAGFLTLEPTITDGGPFQDPGFQIPAPLDPSIIIIHVVEYGCMKKYNVMFMHHIHCQGLVACHAVHINFKVCQLIKQNKNSRAPLSVCICTMRATVIPLPATVHCMNRTWFVLLTTYINYWRPFLPWRPLPSRLFLNPPAHVYADTCPSS